MDARKSQSRPLPIIGVGASAGGLEALRQTFSAISQPTGMAFVVVQHLDPNHESMMAELVERHSQLPVHQIAGGEQVLADHIYVIPPGFGLAIDKGRLKLTEFSDPRGMRRPIDDFFDSLAQDQKSLSACVILSGTGADGSRGLRAIKELGGICAVQDPQTARYDGMPLSAVGTGLVDFVLQPEEIVATLNSYFDRKLFDGVDPAEALAVADHVDDVCRVIKESHGHDFSGYKRTTLNRRIARRMQVLGIEEGTEYLAKIRNDSQECSALFRDLLINVTRFFRDPEAFDSFNESVVLPLVRQADAAEELRIWVPGCSSGEEAYSMAMLFAEAMRVERRRLSVQIFASDIDEQMLKIAREGAYPVIGLADIPEHLRMHYTIGHGNTFTVTPGIRDMVRFSAHNLIKDPPFSRMDVISCRNLLIYFDDRLQQTVMPLFHYALKPGGHLLLGTSETIGRHEDLFEPIDQLNRLFRRTKGSPRYPLPLPSVNLGKRRAPSVSSPPAPDQSNWLEGDALHKLTQNYGPAGLLVDREGTIVASWGQIGRYFEFPSHSERRLSAPALAKPGLREVVGALVREAGSDGKRHIARDVEAKVDFGNQQVNVICDPVRDGHLLIVVKEAGPFLPLDGNDLVELTDGDDQVQVLEDELRITRHRLRSTVEELETANEELKSSNEEMMSMNEELQSTNEELTTVNDELKNKVDQLSIANDDLKNLYESTQLAVIVVDPDLKVRNFTEAACTIFPFKAGDRGRLLSEITAHLETSLYADQARHVIRTGEVIRDHVRTTDGRDFSLRITPYRQSNENIDGATFHRCLRPHAARNGVGRGARAPQTGDPCRRDRRLAI